MSFVSNALFGSLNNGFNATSGAGNNAPQIQQQADTNLQNVLTNQGTLAQQLLAQSQGQGPNIAQLQLQQATNQNIQQGAGQIASQRGMNPALAARIIAQNTAMANQNEAGQSGILRAQQQLAAQQGLANVYGQQAGENLSQLGQLTAAQSAANQTNAGIAAQNSQLGGGLVGGILGSVGTLLHVAHGGDVSPQKQLEQLLTSTGDKVKPIHLAEGGPLSLFGNSMIPQYAPSQNSYVPTPMPGLASPSSMSSTGSAIGSGAASLFGKIFSSAQATNPIAGATSLGSSSSYDPNLTAMGNQLANNPGQAAGNAGWAGIDPSQTNETITQGDTSYQNAAHGGMIKAMVSPGERYIPPHLVESVRKGKMLASRASPKVPGKAKVKGNSEENDTVPAELESGGVVIPRTEADNDKDAREFLLAIKADKDKKSGPSGYARVLAAKRKNA